MLGHGGIVKTEPRIHTCSTRRASFEVSKVSNMFGGVRRSAPTSSNGVASGASMMLEIANRSPL
jgi:hypothetical protein